MVFAPFCSKNGQDLENQGAKNPTKNPQEHPTKDFSHFRVVNNTNKRPWFKY